MLMEERVDLVIKIAEAMLPKALVLDLGDLDVNLTKILEEPLVGLDEVAALRGEARAALLRLSLHLLLHRDEPIQHQPGLLIVPSHHCWCRCHSLVGEGERIRRRGAKSLTLVAITILQL